MNGLKILRYQLQDVLRSRWVVGYALLLFGVTEMLFRFGGSGERVILSLLNVVLILLPLVSLIFGTMYVHQARKFIELLLTQPVARRSLFLGLFGGVALPLAGAFLLGTGLPFLFHGSGASGAQTMVTLLVIGVVLTVISCAVAFLVAVRIPDRAMGLGVAILIWLLLTVVYDAVVLLLIGIFGAYPLEGPALVATLLNPIDLGRVVLLLHFDVAALMGYTGAVFRRFFGTGLGMSIAIIALGAWAAIPLFLALHRFDRSDF